MMWISPAFAFPRKSLMCLVMDVPAIFFATPGQEV